MGEVAASRTTLSLEPLSKTNNKNISENKQTISHKLGVTSHRSTASGNSNRKKSGNNIPIKNLKASNNLVGSSNTHSSSVSNMRVNIALIMPTFTAAAYDNAFYKFYFLFIHRPARTNVTTHLDLLSNKIPKQLTPSSSSASTMSFLPRHLKMSFPKSSINVLTDADVDSGSIFVKKGITNNNINNNKYDVIVIGHQEYVTQREYDNLKQFVANGGTLIVLDGNVFYAEVKYNNNTDVVTLVKGHGWTFNGKSAWESVNERWKQETSQWVGSNYLCYSCKITFLNNPFGYKHHEEQHLTNPKDKILMDYDAEVITSNKKISISRVPIAKPVIATYQLNYQRGKVIVLGIYSDDIISNPKFDKFFDGLLLLQHAL